MGTGWRRAFCTRDPASTISDKHPRSPSPRSCARLGFIPGSSNPSTPRLHCTTIAESTGSEKVTVNKSSRTPRATKSPKTVSVSNPTSPRSPLKLSLFKNSFKFRNSCGICLNSVKTGQGTAIYTAECGHAFHFPCITAHVRKHGNLVCPVCNATWRDVPLLAAHKNLAAQSATENHVVQRNASDKNPTENTASVFKTYNKHSDSARSYDDDEPLLFPTSGSRIIPIPEADNEDAGEFQGFFVNSKNSSSSKSYSVPLQPMEGDSRTVQVKLMPECAVISASRTHETYALLLKVKAPRSSATPSQRAPIDLVTVLDVGGSMSSEKLQMLKQAMRLVVSSLGGGDRLSIVAFSATSKRLLPLRRMTGEGQRVALRIVDGLVIGGGSSVGDALTKATRVLEDRRERNPVASVMLLSDAQEERFPNQRGGNNERKSWTRFAHIEIPVHAFGFGAKSGYSQEPGEEGFEKCVGGLLSVVVQDLRIQVGLESESESVEISAIYSCSGRPTLLSAGAVRLGDLYVKEERELLVELKVASSSSSSSGSGSRHVMTVRCLYKDPSTQEIVYGREQGLEVPPPQNVRGCSCTRIQRLRNLFITTRAIAESRKLLDHAADFTSAHHLLASARALLMQSNSASSEEYVRGLEAELADLHWRRQLQLQRRRGTEREVTLVDENEEPLTPTSAWKAAEKLAKMAMMKNSLNRVSDLHGFENARF